MVCLLDILNRIVLARAAALSNQITKKTSHKSNSLKQLINEVVPLFCIIIN